MFSWVSFLTYAIITAATPGPNNIMSLSNASRLGFKKAIPFNLGIWLGFSAVTSICTLFCTLLSAVIPRIKLPMMIVGAAYMLYLAWKTFKSAPVVEEKKSKSGFLSGAFLQFINPKAYIYAIVSMEAYILPFYGDSFMALLGFALLLAFIGFAFTVCWAAFGHGFKLLFSKYARITNAIMALLLVCCAVTLFL